MLITKECELFKEIGLSFQVIFIFSYPSLVTFLVLSVFLTTSCSFLLLHLFCFPRHLTLDHSSLSENLSAGIFHESICIELFIDTIKSAFV